MAPGSADGSHYTYTCCSQVTCSRRCSARDYSRAHGSAPLVHCPQLERQPACVVMHTPTLVHASSIRHDHPQSNVQHGHNASHFACAHALTLTGRQSARAFWPVRLSTQVCALSSLGSAPARETARLSRLLRSRVVALLSARASARPEWLCFRSGLARHATSGSA